MGGQAAAFVAAVKDFHHRVHRAHRGALYSPLFSVSSAPSVVNLALKLRLARAAAKIPNSSRNGPSIRSGRKRPISVVPISTETGFGSPEGRLRVAKYDVAIIGSGPGGYVAAIRAGELGLKTVVVEKDPFLGGTCLHVGCIPTKVLLHHAEVYDHFKNAAELGFEVSGLKINWANVLARKDKIVKKHAKGIEFLFKKNKVEWVQGWGRYEGPGKISVEKDGKKTAMEASNVLLVSGSEAKSLPGIEPDHKTILTNRSIIELPEIPKTLVVVGAGAVGVEFASIYNSFGTQVTILEALPRVVPVEDEEISAELAKAFQKKGIQIFTGCTVDSVKKDVKGVTVSFKDKDGKAQTLQAEKLLLAVGRKPMTEDCGLEKSKARVERGFVHAGPYMETDEKGLYAIGDIVAGLTHLEPASIIERSAGMIRRAGASRLRT